jgi:peptidoglycan hydrolase CwlO-like protein
MRHFFSKKLVVLFVIFSLFVVRFAIAQECHNAEECGKKVAEYEAKLKEIRTEKNTLSSQISLMDTQINLTVAKIKNTEHTITKTAEEIENLSGKIEGLNGSLDYLSKVLLQKIVKGYKTREISALDIVLDSGNVTSLENRIKYLESAQNADRRLAFKLQQTKVNFEEQKNLREEKKVKLEELKISLDKQKIDLGVQKTQKQGLLTQTQGDEKKYQQLLAQALAEFQAIDKALASGTQIGPVKKGDPIALVGNTGYPGCSTGAHLHFEVRRDGTWTDPSAYLSGKGGLGGSGSWDWPLQDPIVITQGYGHTPWSYRYAYSGGIHTGLDMISKSSDVIRSSLRSIVLWGG